MHPTQRKQSDSILSLRTCNALEIQGYGLVGMNETKRTQVMGEYLEKYFYKSKVISSGGMAEGTAIFGSSDSDNMGVINGLVVVDNDRNEWEDQICISSVRTGCFPGYCKLKFSTEQYRKFKMLENIFPRLRHFYGISKSVKDMFISSKLFCENVIPGNLIPGDNFDDVLFDYNGPAKTNHGVDYVHAFKMQTWPEEAKKWKSRVRRNTWPSTTLLNILENEVSCYVVPIGHKLSTEFDLEWRFSFVEIERQLIWNMNESQFKCYVFLKMLKQAFKEYRIFEEITTYHIKNIMFWMCETVPECDWTPRKLILCVKRCLKKLKVCMKEKRLDHYIIPENNLFESKTFESKEIEPSFSGLHKYMYDLTAQLLQHRDLLLDLKLVSRDVIAYCDKSKLILAYCSQYHDPSFSGGFRKAFPEAELMMPCVKIVQALAKWREELLKSAEGEYELCLETAVNMIKEGHEIDYAQSTINTAEVYFMHANYHQVVTHLKSLLSNRSMKLYISSLGTLCWVCFSTGKMHIAQKSEKCGSVKDLQNDRNNLVTDFDTEYVDRYTLPYPLALQLCLSSYTDSFRYNPVVISYYLLCIAQIKLGLWNDLKDAMRRFELEVRHNKDRKDYYLSLVLLGHCLYWAGDLQGAYNCYAESIRIKRSVRNVAVYHMSILINEWCRNNPL